MIMGDQAIHNVLHVPEFKFNLLSVSKLTRELSCVLLPSSLIFVYFRHSPMARSWGLVRKEKAYTFSKNLSLVQLQIHQQIFQLRSLAEQKIFYGITGLDIHLVQQCNTFPLFQGKCIPMSMTPVTYVHYLSNIDLNFEVVPLRLQPVLIQSIWMFGGLIKGLHMNEALLCYIGR